MIRRYDIIDPTTFERTGRTIDLDLDDPRLTQVTVLEADLGRSMGPARSIDRGAAHDAATDAAESAGEFSTGERPVRRRVRVYPESRPRPADPVGGAARDWRAGYTQVGPPTMPPA